MGKHKMQDLLENAGYDCRDYSGRGMYGKSCLAVTLGTSGRHPALATLIVEVLDNADADDLEVVLEALGEVEQDNMGHDVVYYFPQIPFAGEEEETEEEELNRDATIAELNANTQ